VHQRRLARPRRPHDRAQMTLLDVEGDASESLDGCVALPVAPGDSGSRDDNAAIRPRLDALTLRGGLAQLALLQGFDQCAIVLRETKAVQPVPRKRLTQS
jgi:hypothetical protein